MRRFQTNTRPGDTSTLIRYQSEETVSNIPAGSLEILNFESYQRVANKDQPSILLHGFAHALYHSLAPDERFDIDSTFRTGFHEPKQNSLVLQRPHGGTQIREVMKTGKYDKVLNYFGKSVEHYGKKNAPTYFAEKCFQNDTAKILTVKI